MRSRRLAITLATTLALAWPTSAPTAQTREEYYYGIEINGTLCGYVKVTAEPRRTDGREHVLLTHDSVIRSTLLGGPVDVRLTLTYHTDVEMRGFTEHRSLIERGPTRMASALRIDGGRALLAGRPPGEEEAVPLPPDVVLANTLRFPHLVTDFVGAELASKTYRVFDGRDNAVRDVTYTRTGTDTLHLAGRAFQTVVLESIDRRTGAASTVWIDRGTGIAVQTRHPGRRLTYLAGPDVVDAVTRPAGRPDISAAVMTPTNVTIRDVRAISYMKVRASMRPAGLWLSPAALTVAGQQFTGTVRDNAVDGVFEIQHRTYDGAHAPPFPPAFGGDPALRPFLASEALIQADDPVLAAKAREITAGSQDAWDATRRLSVWIGANIKGAIPGGGSARGTYDQRAGECGGHSFLMAAFARAVGIPARAVWGCMYTPRNGGEFGQHAWNEVYMGEAGWIPIDTTIGEADYIDSGHIRIGVFQSVATSLNGQRFEVLDHRVSAPAAPRQRQRLAPAWSGARAPGQAGAAEAAEALLGALADPRPTVRRDAAVEAARAAASGPPAPWDRKAQRCQPERSAATIVSGAVSYGGRRYPLYPATLDAQPGLPSPLTAADGTELVVAILRDGRYGIVPATLRVDERQCDADATDFPSLAATGLHTDVDLARTRVITGRTTREIADLARPGALSVEGFLGAGEDIIDVLARDNRAVMALGLTHPELARPLFHIWNMMRTDIDLGRWDRARHRWSNVEAILSYGRRVSLVAGDTKGGQLSVFNDGLVGGFWIEITREPTAAERRFLQARYRHLGARRMDALVRLLTHMRTGEIQPHYVMWYGFYEGKTPWRVDPIAITFVFGLRTIEEIEAAFPGRLYTVLANAGVSPATRK